MYRRFILLPLCACCYAGVIAVGVMLIAYLLHPLNVPTPVAEVFNPLRHARPAMGLLLFGLFVAWVMLQGAMISLWRK